MNIAYIDGQNLIMATKNAAEPWRIDMKRFSVYLKEKFNVEKAYYFIGVYLEKEWQLYQFLDVVCGFDVVFRSHLPGFLSPKKGNVDTDLVFTVMRDLIEMDDSHGVVIVSGDGDYYKMVKYLESKGRLEKMLFPSRRNASSLYKKLSNKRHAFLDDADVKRKIGRQK